MKDDRSGRGLFLRVMVAMAAASLSLIFVEAALRAIDWPPEDPVWEPCRETAFRFAANLNYRHMSPEFDVRFQTNRLGLRDDEVQAKRGFRVLVLGDSHTCGYGVERPRLFADLLEDRLHVEVINAGVGGFEIIHQLHFFRSQGRRLQPDLVVYALYLNNDLTGNREWRSGPAGELERRDGKPALETRGTAKLVCLIKRVVPLRRLAHSLRRRWSEPPEANPSGRCLSLCADPLDHDSREDLEMARDLLCQLHDEVAASGAELVVASFPLKSAVEAARPEAYRAGEGNQGNHCDLLRPVDRVAAILHEAGIPHIALTEVLREQRWRLGIPLYYRADGHLNAAGHRCIADALTPCLAAILRDRGVDRPSGADWAFAEPRPVRASAPQATRNLSKAR